MPKKNISASVDEDVETFLSQEHVNCSGLINKLVKQHMNAGMTDNQIRKFRERQVQSEIEMLESQLQTKESELKTIKDAVEETTERETEAIDRRLESLQDVRGVIDETHPSVEAVAEEHFQSNREKALQAFKERNAELELVPEEYL
jgi:hypothetical protein